MLILLPLVFFGLYAVTLLPGVGWGDVAKYQTVAAEVGWPLDAGLHGLYSILLSVWVNIIPLGEVAWRANLFSAIASATALGIFIHVCLALGLSRRSVLLSAGSLGLSHVFWTNATWAESYPLFSCLWLLAVGRGLLFLQNRRPHDLVMTLGFFGLTVWVNLMAVQALAVFALVSIVLVPECRRPSTWFRPALALLLGLSPWMARILWALTIERLDGHEVFARVFDLQFSSHLWIRHAPGDWIRGAAPFLLYLVYQCGAMTPYFLNVRRLPVSSWLFPVLLAGFTGLFCSTFLPQRAVWILTAAWLPLFILLAMALEASLPARKGVFALPLVVVAGYALAPGVLDGHLGRLVHVEPVGKRDTLRIFLQPWKQGERSAGDYVDEVEANLKSGDILVCDFTPGAPLRYAQKVQGRLSHLRIVSLGQDFKNLIDKVPPGSQLWLGRDSPEFHKRIDASKWRTVRVGTLLRVEKLP